MKSKITRVLQNALLEAVSPGSGAKPAPAKISVSSATLNSRTEMIEDVLDNMLDHISGVILVGPTGIGKTTFVAQLAELVGMNAVVVEAPHITEEHLVNIPFMVYNPITKAKKAGSEQISTKDWDVVYGKSHLVSLLQAQRPVSDQELLNHINTNASNNTKAIWQALGGTNTSIPRRVSEVRSKYKSILFLDEFMRQVTGGVRNILRELVIDKRVGQDPLPSNVYSLYASNLQDVGGTVEKMPLNYQFQQIHFTPPNKSDFFHYLTAKFEKDGVHLKPEVATAFYKAIKDEHISFDDVENEIRTSPRRWEQIISYVNAAVPVKTTEDAAALLANIKANFQDIENTSKLYSKVDAIVRDIIRDTSGSELASVSPNSPTLWRDTLMHQVEMAQKMGDARAYVPIVAGQPGIGKTAEMASIADKLNLRLIRVSCSGLRPEDVTGIPLPQEKDGRYDVKFADPPLYKKIMDEMEKKKEAFLNSSKISEARKQEWLEKSKQYLLFFDEFNRPEEAATYNTLRRVILNKSFTDDVKLPDNIIVVAAMNPTDIKTQPLTGHMKDATDYIAAAPRWSSQKDFHDSEALMRADLSEEASEIARMLVHNFADKFKLDVPDPSRNIHSDSRQFYIQVGDDDVYISGREYSDMLLALQRGLDRVVEKKEQFVRPDGEFDSDGYVDAVLKMASKKIMMTMDNVLFKNEVDREMFVDQLDLWLQEQKEKLTTAETTGASLESIFDSAVRNPSKHLKDNVAFMNWVDTQFSPADFTNEFLAWLTNVAAQEANKFDLLVSKTHNKKVMQDGVVQISQDLIDKVNFIVDEIIMAMNVHKLSSQIGQSMEAALRKFWSSVFIADIERMEEEAKDLAKTDQAASKAALAAVEGYQNTLMDYQRKIAAKVRSFRKPAGT
jgi:MoxR-like ATPase